jgi:GT2 family glycosyltransferase
MSAAPSVSSDLTVVMPTYRRPDLAAAKAGWISSTWKPAALIVVVDGPGDATAERVRASAPNALLLELASNVGAPAAFNRGAERCDTAWTLRVDDDDHHPEDFASVLLGEAHRQQAAVAAAPWVHCGDRSLAEALAHARRDRRCPVFGDHPSTFPPDPGCFTPFMPGNMLARTEVFRTVRFDESLKGNAWREESDFYLRCAELGHRTWLTPFTHSWISDPVTGGQHSRSRLSYEWHTLRNNQRFLRRHRRALGLTRRGAVVWESAAFELDRARPIARSLAARARRRRNRDG